MQPFAVAAISLNQTPLDWDGNEANLRAALDRARAGGARLVCFPELCISGYGCEDTFLWPNTWDQAFRLLERLVPETQGLVVAFGLPLSFEGQVFNAVALVVDGRLCGFAAKRHLAGDGLHYEPRWFRPWPVGLVRELVRDGKNYPIGDLVFDVAGVRLGFEICEDAWVVDRPGHELMRAQVDVILNPSASHFAFGKHERRRELVVAGARDFGAAYVYANLLGNEAGRAIYDGDAWVATCGQVQAEARRFSFAPFSVTWGLIDVDAERLRRLEIEAPARTTLTELRPLIQAQFDWGAGAELPQRETALELDKAEAFSRAISLGLYDYLRKSRSRGFVVSLSGGADSAAVAVLARLAVRRCVAELGLDALLNALAYIWPSDRPASEEVVVRRLLTTVYQATQNSSETTRLAALGLACELGAEHHEWGVQEFVDGYTNRVETALGRELTWSVDDLALQNIQARARAPGVWMLANVRGALLLATSNRSEAAVGYATMDGDTAGGLSPLAGIDKFYLRAWLRHVETEGLVDLGPVVALGAVNRQAPTAELRPSQRHQTDEEDLMPYDVLDVVERAAVLERKSPLQVFEVLRERFTGAEPAQLLAWTQRFFRLFARSQWKRERYAPSFHVDEANLDPKTWCRFPILSGGFERELRELELAWADSAISRDNP